MRGEKTQSLQNRFSAYVVAAVSNRRARYLENKNRNKQREYAEIGRASCRERVSSPV